MGNEFGTTAREQTNMLQPESQLQPDAADTRLRDMHDETMEAPSATSEEWATYFVEGQAEVDTDLGHMRRIARFTITVC